MNLLKLPISKDGFFNEIHIKLRPVETVIDGVFIAGAGQSPKTMAESVGASLAAVSKAGGLLMKGYVDLEPLIARVDTDKCLWCDECLKACPYGAIEKVHCWRQRSGLCGQVALQRRRRLRADLPARRHRRRGLYR